MIKRINFVEKKAFSFTYQKLLQICLIVVLLNVAIIAYQYYNVSNKEKVLKKEKAALIKLEAKRDELMKKPVKKKISVGQYQDLLDKIESTPKWSAVLSEMSRHLPNTVWITNFRSSSSSGAATKKDKKSKKKGKGTNKKVSVKTKKEVSTPKHALEVSGLGSDLRNITEFTSQLSQSEYFYNLVLSKSERQSFGYLFTIKSEIKTNVR